MNELTVVDWINWDEAENRESCGSMGGFFTEGMRWKDYIEAFRKVEHLEVLRKEIIKKKIKTTGREHQESDVGVPLFSDGTVGTFSYRGWGDLMAAVWSKEEDADYHYMHFYC